MPLFDDGIIFMVILLVVMGAVVSVGWWVAVIFFGIKAWQAAERQLRQEIPALERMIREYAALPAGQRAAMQGSVLRQLGQMGSHYRQLDDLRRQQYEVRVGEIHGMAASAGLDWTPPSY